MSGGPMAEGANVHPYRELFREWDGHADADAMPIQNMRHIYRAISDICQMRIYIRIDAHRQIYPNAQPYFRLDRSQSLF